MYHRGDREEVPYNPYPSEEDYERRDHHRHSHHHEEEPPLRSGLEHRGPAPPAHEFGGQGYGDSAPHGAMHVGGGGRYEEERRPAPPHGGRYEERVPGPYEEPHRGGQYPPGPYGGPPGGMQASPYPPGPYDQPPGGGRHPVSAAPGPYGDVPHQSSPYAPAPGHRPAAGEMEGPPRSHVPGQTVRLFCKAAPGFHLAVVPRQGPVMVRADPRDPHQMWIKDETMGTRVKDSTGSHAFALINKATGQALRHAPGDLEQCLLAEYEPHGRDETVLWTQSEDMGDGFRCVRMASKITSNLDVLHGDHKSGGVKEGSPVILFPWKKQENQIWKIIPVCKPPT